MVKTPTTDLVAIERISEINEEENNVFYQHLKQQDGKCIDSLVHVLNTEVSAAIDCTSCANCCRSLMINVEPGEPEKLSAYLNIPLQELKDAFIEESQQGKMIVNTIPCHFLSNNICTIYSERFQECREFPHLHKPGFIQRLPGTLMHYGRCPIIFNVIEELKLALNYQANAAS